jgi:hypothetical protein
LREDLGKRRPDIPIETYDYHVNAPAFGRLVADLFVELMNNEAQPTERRKKNESVQRKADKDPAYNLGG